MKQAITFPELSASTEARPAACPRCGRPVWAGIAGAREVGVRRTFRYIRRVSARPLPNRT